MTPTATPIPVGDRALRIQDVVNVADGAEVELAQSALERMRAARAVVDELVNGDSLVYGLNTGLGHMRDQRMPVADLRAYQDAMLLGHDGAIGPPLPTRVVRAAMFVRVAGLATGWSGASPAVAETLIAMLNRGVHPIVPTVGSVGASDLMHMAAIGLVATALGGRAEVDGTVMAGPDALLSAGIQPLRLEPKDGLALISANGVSIGRGALVAARARRSIDLADLAVAVSMEGIGGNPSIVDPIVGVAKGIPGQVESANRIRRFLDGSALRRPGGPASVQDPLSFRVAPQVHGAVREVARFLVDAVEAELAAGDDNPLVSVADGHLVSNGNFHPMVLALTADALRPAIAHVGLLADHRMNHLWTAAFQDPTLMTPDGIAKASEGGGLLLRYAAAARYAELRALASPVTLDVPPLDLGVEDHATNAPFAVLRTDQALDLLDEIIAVELLTARQVIVRTRAANDLGAGVRAALEEIASTIEGLGERPPADILHAAVRGALGGRILLAAEGAAGPH